MLCTLAAITFFALLFLNPESGLNPFPPLAATATQAASSTPTSSVEVSSTPSSTTEPSATATQPPTAIPTVEQLGGTFEIQDGSPSAVDSTVFHPELGCEFLGVAGQAFSADGAPIPDLQVQITGSLDGQDIDKSGLSGAATQYGAGSYYEVQLASQPIASDATLQVTLFGAAGQLSDPFTFSTTDSCQENLIFINFVEQP
ncbi:MAG: hypothetical protein WD740_04305 [Anaerolineales bacterium]